MSYKKKFKTGDSVYINENAQIAYRNKYGRIIKFSYTGYYVVSVDNIHEEVYIKSNNMSKVGEVPSKGIKEKLEENKLTLQKQIDNTTLVIEEINEKLQYLENTDSDTLDMKEFKVYLIKKINNDKNLSEKEKHEKLISLL